MSGSRRARNISCDNNWTTFRLLLWKNWLLQRRHRLRTVVEFTTPLLFGVLLICLKLIAPVSEVSTVTYYDKLSVDEMPENIGNMASNTIDPVEVLKSIRDSFPNKLPSTIVDMLNELSFGHQLGDIGLDLIISFLETQPNTVDIGYAPDTPLIRSTMKRVQQRLSQTVTAKAFATEGLLIEWLSKVQFLANPKIFGIVFLNTENASEFGHDISIKIRPHSKILDKAMSSEPWMTNRHYLSFRMAGPRNNNFSSGGTPGYYVTGFLALQQAITAAIIEQQTGRPFNTRTYIQRMPYTIYTTNDFQIVLNLWLSRFITFSFIYPLINLVKSIVFEKERKLKESMKMMGLPIWLHWTAWFVKSICMLAITCVLLTSLLCIPWHGGDNGAVLSASDPIVVCAFLLVYSCSIIAFGFMVSTFSSNASSGAMWAGLLFIFNYLPFDLLRFFYEHLTLSHKLSCSLLTNTAFGFGARLLSMWEATGEGVQWTNIHLPTPDDSLTMMHIFGMLLLDIVLYLLVAWYVESIHPGEYGVPQPWYFLFTRRYWRGANAVRRTSVDFSSTNRKGHFEESPRNLKAGISVVNLTKVYANGKMAVNNVNFQMYEGQITALLGHNGAGKTTTISMLVGLYTPSSGTAFVNGYDIRRGMDSVRTSLGVCPQHNVLFDELTVAEHFRFFCALKGFNGNYRAEISRMLKLLMLEDKRDAMAANLSGGMKRKLSVGIALCGGSKVVLLDEPTSGMDPSARRAIWDLLQRERKGRTLLLTTHSMDEADILGDRIFIMASGRLQCGGSSLFLKYKYGTGYHLTMVKKPGCDVGLITSFINSFLPSVKINKNIGSELSYILPHEQAHQFERLFHSLEENQAMLRVFSYGASVTTMEEVFIQVIKQTSSYLKSEQQRQSCMISWEDEPDGGDVDGDGGGGGGDGDGDGGGISRGYNNPAFSGDSLSPFVKPNANTGRTHRARRHFYSGPARFLQQLMAMLIKRCLYSLRHKLLTISQIFLPSLIIVTSILILRILPGHIDHPALNLSLKEFSAAETSIWLSTNNSESAKLAKFVESQTDFSVKYSTRNESVDSSLLQLQQQDMADFDRRRIAAFKFDGNSSVTSVFNNQPLHGSGIALASLDQLLLQNHTGDARYRLSFINHPTSKTQDSRISRQIDQLVEGVKLALVTLFAVSFLASTFMFFLIKERSVRSKNLQLISGASISIFRLGHFVYDFLLFTVSCAAILLTYYSLNLEIYQNWSVHVASIALFCGYGFITISTCYYTSLFFTVPSSGFMFIFISYIFSGLGTGITVTVLRMDPFNQFQLAEALNIVFYLVPNFALTSSLVDVSHNFMVMQFCDKFPAFADLCHTKIDFKKLLKFPNMCCKFQQTCGSYFGCANPTEMLFSLKRFGIGSALLTMFLEGCVVLVLCYMADKKVGRKLLKIYYDAVGRFPRLLAKRDVAGVVAPDDDDVIAERERILTSHEFGQPLQDVLVIKNLTKFYSSDFLAVDRLCLGMSKGECFGLLGINGAGKTTTFKMITGSESVSFGYILFRGRSVKSDSRNFFKNIGYCPQFDALLDHMTGKETMRLFARLRGIPEKLIDETITKLSSRLYLTEQLNKLTGQYSGGNKRKLSTAIALLGDPPLVLLDEPTAGMDPLARRMLWDVICRVRARGQTIILTSHSMEECETLCTRIAIMVDGQFKCLGSPQHLKKKFGLGFSLIIKTRTFAEKQDSCGRHNHRRTKSVGIVSNRRDVIDGSRRVVTKPIEGFDLRRSLSDSQHLTMDDLRWERTKMTMGDPVDYNTNSLSANMDDTATDGKAQGARTLKEVQEYIDNVFPGALLKDIHQNLLNYRIPDSTLSWADIFGIMERAKISLAIEDYSVSQTTLEQVFLHFSKGRSIDA